jgi:hypothetical protein
MKPGIIEKDEMIIVGMIYYGNPFHDTAAAPEQRVGRSGIRDRDLGACPGQGIAVRGEMCDGSI